MTHRLNLIICCIILSFFPGNSCIIAQILNDPYTLNLIKSDIGKIYNLEFNNAEMICREIELLYPDHPVNYLLRGIITYWKNYPLVSNSPARQLFEENLNKCIEKSELKPYSADYEAESLLADISARGLLLLFYADNDLILNVIPLATRSFKYLMRSFDFVSSFNDFYYFTGTYNYYRDAYPRIHPVYKPFASLFTRGDEIKGLNELTMSAEHSIFLRAESYSLLTWIYTGFENNYLQALKYSEKLTSVYPENLFFRALHIKNLLLLNEFNEAEDIIKHSIQNSGNAYFDAQVMIFNGILQEKKYKNLNAAKQFYEEGINALSPFGDYGNEFCAYAYFGLSRICGYYGDNTCKRTYQRRGLDLAEFKKITFD